MTANPAPSSPNSAAARLVRGAAGISVPPRLPSPENVLGTVLEEFGEDYQVTVEEFCVVAVRRPTPTVQVITIGRTAEELLAKLRAERDGAS
jgi:hypothetical protein